MNPMKYALAGALAATAPASLVAATAATSATVGVRETTLKAASDTLVAPAYTRPPAYVGKTVAGDGASITVSGAPGWASARFTYAAGTQPDHFYAVLGAGPSGTANPLEGLACDVISNGSDILLLDTADDLASVPAGSAITVIPHWTLATFFPPSDAGKSFVVSTSALQRRTQVFQPNLAARGINPSPSATYFFHKDAWRKVGEALTTDYGDTPISDSAYLIVRNSEQTDLRLRLSGTVSAGVLRRPVATLAASQRDNCFSTGRPIPVSLASLDFIASGAFSTSASALNRKDQLFVYDNTRAGYNKSPSATYFHYNGAWRKVGAAITAAFDNDTLEPDAGFIIRKAAAPSSPDWTAAPSFPKP